MLLVMEGGAFHHRESELRVTRGQTPLPTSLSPQATLSVPVALSVISVHLRHTSQTFLPTDSPSREMNLHPPAPFDSFSLVPEIQVLSAFGIPFTPPSLLVLITTVSSQATVISH